MCTLAVAFRTDPRFPLVVAANRDERLGRASEGWALRATADGLRYAAPRDAVAGGTWIGISARGLFAAVTNYHAPVAWYPDPDRRSRGELVALALAAGSAREARAALAPLTAERWNPFHLVVADRESAFLWWYDGASAGAEPLAPGLHVVTESARGGEGPRAELVRARWPLDLSPARLRDLLAVHAGGRVPPEAATCIHGDPAYGTRSAAVLRLAGELSASELLVADGRPCTSPLEDRSSLLVSLARAA
jgi:uncharacterized protein with NRDE domain